ncbi:MAG: peptidase [Planctomycetota bacterium]|jgi:tRNA threonylcarbamoyl adenosine modification protein YeaZ
MKERAPHVILAIDCSQRRSHLVVARDTMDFARVFARSFESADQRDREPFWDELRSLFAEAGVTAADITAIAVANGPGGFTGLRVATSFAKGFALARNTPIVAVPSAILFAASDAARGGMGPWLVALAAKGETAWSTVVSRTDPQAAGVELVMSEPRVVDSAEFSVLAAQIHAAQVHAADGSRERGGGVLLADEHLGSSLAESAVNAGLAMRGLEIDPNAFVREATRRLRAGETIDALTLAPIYAREPEAVTKWRERALSARRDA